MCAYAMHALSRRYVKVNFAYTHKFSERLLDRVLRLSDNVTRVETGVTLSNDLISGLDNISPKATLEVVRDIQMCHGCQSPTARPVRVSLRVCARA